MSCKRKHDVEEIIDHDVCHVNKKQKQHQEHKMLIIAGTHYGRATHYVKRIFGDEALDLRWQVDLLNIPEEKEMNFDEKNSNWSYKTILQPFQAFSCQNGEYDLIVWEFPPCDLMVGPSIENSGLHHAFQMLSPDGIMLIPNPSFPRPNLSSNTSIWWKIPHNLTTCQIATQLFSNCIIPDQDLDKWAEKLDYYVVLFNK